MARRYGISRKQRQYISLIILLITLCIYIGQQHGYFGGVAKKVEVNQPGLYSIDHFIDGDTIAVNMNGHVEEIRFVGVDTPETHKPNTPVQCYGPEAAAYTKQRITEAGSKVRLQSDADSTNRDRYDRLLRYVYLPDGTLMEEALIQNGYGFFYPYFPFTKSAQFHADEITAQVGHKGLWAHCTPTASDDGGYKMEEGEPANL